jgi:hypothetical protein
MERFKDEMVWYYFKIRPRHTSGSNQRTYEKFRSGASPSFEQGISWMQDNRILLQHPARSCAVLVDAYLTSSKLIYSYVCNI